VWQSYKAVAQALLVKIAGSARSLAVACGKIGAFICQGVCMASLLLDLALSAERMRAVYQGRANRILVQSRDGRRVSVPAHHFRPFLTHEGVYGCFELEFNAAGQLLGLRRLG
jgi:hypothetical protein